jgi:hypothetical protein
MSATEIIEEIQKLPVADQERVLDFLQHAQSERRSTDQPGVRYACDEDFKKVADKVLTEHAELFRRLAQ